MTMLLAIAALLFVVAVHPFVTYPLSLMLMRRSAAPLLASPDDPRPSLALCCAAYNEEKVIVAKAEAMLAMAALYGPATVHIYVDGSVDGTAALLAPYADRIDIVIGRERVGKTAGLNTLIARSESALIAFTDANVETPVHGLVSLAAPLADPSIGCTSAKLVYSNARESSTSEVGSLYWQLEELLKGIESDTVGMIGVDGAFFVVRRSLYEPAPRDLIDDLYVSLVVMLKDRRVVTVESVLVHERSAIRWIEEYRRKRRIACQAMNVHRTLWPRLVKLPLPMLYAYVSHRLIKWLIPFLLAGSGLFFLAWLFTVADPLTLAILGGAALLVAAASVLFQLRPVGAIVSAIASIAGVGVGVLESWFLRKTYQTWLPALSVREASLND